MDLAAYKRQFGVSYSHLGRLCGCTAAMVSLIASNNAKPAFELAVKIEAATKGYVGRENWYPPRESDISITIGKVSA